MFTITLMLAGAICVSALVLALRYPAGRLGGAVMNREAASGANGRGLSHRIWARVLAALAAVAVGAAGCSGSASSEPAGAATATATSASALPASVDEALAGLVASHWVPANAEYSRAQTIDLAGGSVEIDEPGAYRLIGTLADGQVKVEVEEKGLVQLVLDGADITSSQSSAIDIEAADEVVLILADGSQNSLTDAAAYAVPDEEPDAALFSKVDLSIAGSGALTVTGRQGDAVTSKDGLVLAGGEVVIEAADDAIKGRDYLQIVGGRLVAEAGGDGLKSTNADDAGTGYVLLAGGEVTVEAAADCVDAATDALVTSGSATLTCGDDAIHADGRLVVDGGSVEVAESYEGLEAPVLVVAGGVLDITASDDGLNAAASSESDDAAGDTDAASPSARPGRGFADGGGMGVQEGVALAITGGEVRIKAGSDGIDANGPGTISGGTVEVYAAAYGADGPFDIAEGGPAISGGTVTAYAAGGGGCAMVSPDQASAQGWIAAVLPQAATGTLELIDNAGGAVASLTAAETVCAVVYSSPDVVLGEVYTLRIGDLTAEVTAGQAMAGAAGNGAGRGPGGRGQGGNDQRQPRQQPTRPTNPQTGTPGDAPAITAQ
ncbi:MAG: carbohydrate-binding domain-containing protein [Bifidobacteriaceae bacterium]|nr:carbohydrate-binding domain-containing protein [Bifidobacteriaceae bacterium]